MFFRANSAAQAVGLARRIFCLLSLLFAGGFYFFVHLFDDYLAMGEWRENFTLDSLFLLAFFALTAGAAGVCQTPGYGEKPDRWAPYESGQYFEQLRKIARTYRFDSGKIAYLHFEVTDTEVGPVELFRIPVGRSADCSENDCLLCFCSCRFSPQRSTARDPMSIHASRSVASVQS